MSEKNKVSDGTCFYCKRQFERYDLRPYGPNSALVCSGCAIDPRYTVLIQTNMGHALDDAKLEVKRRKEAGEKVAIRIDEIKGYTVVPASDIGPDDIVELMDLDIPS